MSLLGLAQQGLWEVSQVRNQKEVFVVLKRPVQTQCKWTRAHDAFQPSYLLGSARVCPSLSHMWAQSHSCPEHYTLQHLLMTKEGAVYTYFYSSIKRWPANKKKNQAHLVLCAECPQINRIKWAFSPHVKFRWKDWHWMCTLILCSWNSVLPNSNVLSSSSKLLAPHFCLSCLQTAQWDGGVAEILSLWMACFWKCNKKAGKARGQQTGPSFPFFPFPAQAPRPMPSKCTDLALGYTPVEALGIRHIWRWGFEVWYKF